MPQRPQSNGKVERFNLTFKEMLAKAVKNAPGDREDHVGSNLFSHHISVSDVTHYSPFYFIYGRPTLLTCAGGVLNAGWTCVGRGLHAGCQLAGRRLPTGPAYVQY